MGFSANQGAALLMILAILAVNASFSASSPSIEFSGNFFPMEPECNRSTTEYSASGSDRLFFLDGDDDAAEFQMDSEINRRILAERRYISYGALRRNSVPCSRRGASYYNCRRGAQANPYSRGCSAITRCRR